MLHECEKFVNIMDMVRSLDEEPKYSFKIIVLGSKGVGKSSLLKRFEFDQFEDIPSHTIGVGTSTKSLRIGLDFVQVKLFYILNISVDILQCLLY